MRGRSTSAGAWGTIAAACALTACTPAHPSLRGEVSVTQPHPEYGGQQPAAFATVVFLVPGAELSALAPPAQTVVVNEQGTGAWPSTELRDTSLPPAPEGLVVAHAHGRGLAVRRAIHAGIEAEQPWRWLVLWPTNEHVLRTGLQLVQQGHERALGVEDGVVVLPPADFPRWLVFAPDEGAYLAQRLEPSHAAFPVALPPGFVGDVFAVWGSASVATGSTAPAHVAGGRADG
jgi:hypothetical protein